MQSMFLTFDSKYPAGRNGSDIGVADIPKRMEAQIKACPDIKFVLSGYSQGGGVITRSVATLPANLAQKVIAIALYGAGDGSRVKDSLKEKTIANCAPGDFVSDARMARVQLLIHFLKACPNPGTGAGHVSYNNKGTIWHDRSSKYIVESFKRKGLGLKTMRSPTDPL
jgi:hypothetical protein